MPNEKLTIDVSYQTLWRIALWVVLFFVAYYVRDILMVLLLSIILASVVEIPVRFFYKFKIPRIASVLIIYALAIFVFALVVYLLLPPLVVEIKNLSTALPPFFYELADGSFLPQIRLNLESATNLLDIISGWINSQTNILSALTSFFGGASSAVIAVVISFYLSTQEKGIEKFLHLVLPHEKEQYIIDLWRRAQNKIANWLRGQLALGLSMGVLVFVGLKIIGIKYALILGIVAAVFEIVPFVGPILAAVPAIVLAFLQAPILAFWTAGMFLLAQQFENHVLVPLVMRRLVSMNPVIVILALIFGAKLGGILGALLGVPIMSVIEEVVADFNKRKNKSS
ncbi:MAG: hypothetical protein UT37_C0007G0027 [Parcubacteria group bacterium GW2011_GWA2_39_18]|nr:MAG: hypothetical protein UT37_C0007G0027 [Parcubacteria group bacterium GW2011_GWA2_39_18]